MPDEDLTEQEIRQLLKDAENRLKTNHKNEQIDSRQLVKNLRLNISTIATTQSIEPYINGLTNIPSILSTHLVSNTEKTGSTRFRTVVDPVAIKKEKDNRNATAGMDWYNIPKTQLTPELSRDLQLLRMRDVLDPKRHYKKDVMRNNIPEFSQVGTIIEGPTEYFSGRLSNKERKRTIVEEILENEKATGRFKKKYAEIQKRKISGKKAHYKKLRSMRTKNSILKY